MNRIRILSFLLVFITNISLISSSRYNSNCQSEYDLNYPPKDENEIASSSRIQQPNILKKTKLFFKHGWKEKSIFIPSTTLALSTLIRLKKSSSKLQRLSLPSIAFLLTKGYFFSKKLTEEIKNLDNQMHRITDEEYNPKKKKNLYVKKIEKVLQNIFLPSEDLLLKSIESLQKENSPIDLGNQEYKGYNPWEEKTYQEKDLEMLKNYDEKKIIEIAEKIAPEVLLEILFSSEGGLSSQKSKAILSQLTASTGKRLLIAASSNPSEKFKTTGEALAYITQLCNALSPHTVANCFKENIEKGPFLCAVINRMNQNKVNQVLGLLNPKECGQILAFCMNHSQNERIINTKKLKDIFQSMKYEETNIQFEKKYVYNQEQNEKISFLEVSRKSHIDLSRSPNKAHQILYQMTCYGKSKDSISIQFFAELISELNYKEEDYSDHYEMRNSEEFQEKLEESNAERGQENFENNLSSKNFQNISSFQDEDKKESNFNDLEFLKKTACYEILNKQNQILPDVLIEYILKILPDRNNNTNSKFKIIMDGLTENTISNILSTEKFLDIDLANIRILIDSFSGLKIDTSQYIINILTTMNKRKALDVLISIDYDKKPALKNILNTLDISLIGSILCTANIEEDLFMKKDKDYQAIGKFFSHITNENNKNKILQSLQGKNKPIYEKIKFKIDQYQEIEK